MQKIEFHLHLSPEQYLAYYRGQAKFVQIVAADGRIVRFPAEILREFVTHDGVVGNFILEIDADHKCRKLQRLEKP